MKQQIIDLTNNHPKHYTVMIRKNPAMMQWIDENTMVTTDYLPARIYSAVHGISDICENGNQKKFHRLGEGFIGCGPAATCKCTRDSIASTLAVVNRSKSPEEKARINELRKATMIETYGYAFNNHRPEVVEKLKAPKISGEALTKLSDKKWLQEEYVNKQRTGLDIAIELNVDTTTVKAYLLKGGFTVRKRSNYSIYENQIGAYLKSIGIEHVQGDVGSLGDRRELDILVSSHNVAFELNGLYWHSYHPSVKNTTIASDKHYKKTFDAATNGIKLFQFTDREWLVKTDVVKSIMAVALGKHARTINSTDCVVSDVDQCDVDVKSFIIKNSLNVSYDDDVTYKVAHYNNEVVMIFGYVLASDNEAKLKSVVTILDTKINDKLQLIMNYIYTTNPLTTTITTVCDLAIHDDSDYNDAGFVKDAVFPPSYVWTDGDDVVTRDRCNTDTLPEWLPSYDESKTVDDNMFDAKYRKYFDCGHQKYVHTKE